MHSDDGIDDGEDDCASGDAVDGVGAVGDGSDGLVTVPVE